MERNHKIKSDFGMGDYYRFHQKKYNKISRKMYGNIITDFNKALWDMIIEDNLEYTLPKLGFQLVLMKEKRSPKIKDGKLLNNIPVDWKKTKQLWNRDQEAKDKKLLVRYNNSHTSGYIFRIYFKKFSSRITHRSVYKFQTNREFKRTINKKIKNPNLDIDAYLLYNKKYYKNV